MFSVGSRIKYFLIPILFILISPVYALAAISFSNGAWNTSFNYGECSQTGAGGYPSCPYTSPDGVLIGGASASAGGKYTQVVAAANNAKGAGNGLRFWVADGDNRQSGLVRVEFPAYQKDIWVRWYQRYQSGFKWSHLGYSKEMYFSTDGAGISVIPEFAGGNYVLISQGTPDYYQVSSSYGWNSVMGASVADGLFHCYEIRLKMDSNGSNGIGQLWIDGNLKVSKTDVNWSNNNASAQKGWKYFDLHTNQNAPSNGQAMYLDMDDMTIYNVTPSNRDASGNAFIGPIGGSGIGGSVTTAPVPSVLSASALSSIFLLCTMSSGPLGK